MVFLPLGEGDTALPIDTARALAAHLRVGRAEVGLDALTGGVEVRFYFDPALVEAAKRWLKQRGVIFDVGVL